MKVSKWWGIEEGLVHRGSFRCGSR